MRIIMYMTHTLEKLNVSTVVVVILLSKHQSGTGSNAMSVVQHLGGCNEG